MNIYEIRDRYIVLTELLQEISEVFSPTILVTIAYYSVELCIYLYDIVVVCLYRLVHRFYYRSSCFIFQTNFVLIYYLFVFYYQPFNFILHLLQLVKRNMLSASLSARYNLIKTMK